MPHGLGSTCFSLCSFAFPVPSLMLQSFTSGVSHLALLGVGAELGQQLVGGSGRGRQTPGPTSIPLPSVWSAHAETVGTWTDLYTGNSFPVAAQGKDIWGAEGARDPVQPLIGPLVPQVVLWRPAVGDCDPRRQPLPWDSSRAALQPSEDRLPDGEAGQLQRGDVSMLSLVQPPQILTLRALAGGSRALILSRCWAALGASPRRTGQLETKAQMTENRPWA